MKVGRLLLVLGVSLSLLGAGCNQASPPIVELEPDLGPISEPINEEVAIEPEKDIVEPVVAPEPEIKVFDITAKQWEFIPGSLTVNEGDIVRLNITSIDVDHSLVISAFGVNVNLKPGQTEHVEFVADKKGTYSMFCSVFCGSGHGSMKGTLIVL